MPGPGMWVLSTIFSPIMWGYDPVTGGVKSILYGFMNLTPGLHMQMCEPAHWAISLAYKVSL